MARVCTGRSLCVHCEIYTIYMYPILILGHYFEFELRSDFINSTMPAHTISLISQWSQNTRQFRFIICDNVQWQGIDFYCSLSNSLLRSRLSLTVLHLHRDCFQMRIVFLQDPQRQECRFACKIAFEITFVLFYNVAEPTGVTSWYLILHRHFKPAQIYASIYDQYNNAMFVDKNVMS